MNEIREINEINEINAVNEIIVVNEVDQINAIFIRFRLQISTPSTDSIYRHV